MLNTFIFLWGLIPITLGMGFLFRPKKVARAQTRFRKRMEKMERRLFKAHRATGLAFILLGQILLLSWYYPVWIYHAFLLCRIVVGFLFPHLFPPQGIQAVAQVTWI